MLQHAFCLQQQKNNRIFLSVMFCHLMKKNQVDHKDSHLDTNLQSEVKSKYRIACVCVNEKLSQLYLCLHC